ncbi:MAG TPA: response regulator [Gemmataceae bacterium]|nr:response regulator [Gemmataceae bacterium]
MPLDKNHSESTKEDRSLPALAFVHSLLANSCLSQSGLPDVLEELAHAFSSTGAGLAQLPDASLLARSKHSGNANANLPWSNRPELLAQVRSAPLGLHANGNDGCSFMIVAFGNSPEAGWLLWLEDETGRTWSEKEGAALLLAGNAMMRAAPTGGPRWSKQLEYSQRRRRLEDAAPLTRRLGHDFDNVLTGIMGFTELALGQLDQNSPAKPFVAEIMQAAKQGTQMTTQLRWFSRRSAGALRPTALRAVLEAETGSQASWSRDIRLHVELAEGLPLVSLAAEPLTLILKQLLTNAREALAGKGSTTITAKPVTLTASDCLDLLGSVSPGSFVELTVTDDGPGFTAEAERRVLNELFFTTKPRHRGLGLAVVYGILQAYQGALRIDPVLPRGTSVKIYLPAVPTLASSISKPSQADRVLVVDDDPIILQLCSTTLQRAGYQVQTASSGSEALNSYTSAAHEPFHLVISDVLMPRMTGVDLARRLRTQDASVNLLLMSGQTSADLSEEDLPGGSPDFLAKPFRPEGLLSAVRSALERGARRTTANTDSTA